MAFYEFTNADGSVRVHITYGSMFYEYEGYRFEWHHFIYSWPVTKKYEPKKRVPTGFWDMIDRFSKLTEKQREEFEI